MLCNLTQFKLWVQSFLIQYLLLLLKHISLSYSHLVTGIPFFEHKPIQKNALPYISLESSQDSIKSLSEIFYHSTSNFLKFTMCQASFWMWGYINNQTNDILFPWNWHSNVALPSRIFWDDRHVLCPYCHMQQLEQFEHH